jgi:hypothetical protein
VIYSLHDQSHSPVHVRDYKTIQSTFLSFNLVTPIPSFFYFNFEARIDHQNYDADIKTHAEHLKDN